MKNKILQNITSTLRGRLSLWYLTSVGLIIVLFLIAVSSLFWITLQDQIDHHVHIAVNEAKQVFENYRGEERDGLIKNLVSARGMTVVVLSPDGSAVLETNSPDIALVTEHQLQKLLTSSSLYNSIPTHFTENNIRFAAIPAQVSAGKGIVAVGYSTQVLYATLYRMLLVVAGVVFFVVLPITYFGYNLLKKQLKPLEAIAAQAKAVTDTSSLAKRIIMLPIYDVAGREDAEIKRKISSLKLAEAVKERAEDKEIFCLNTFLETKKFLENNLKGGEVVVIMGAGDVYDLVKMFST